MTFFQMTKTVLKSLFSRPATLMYPAKPAKKTANTRGHVKINPDGCITCRSCQRKCPTQAICVEVKEKTWQIDQMRCVVCSCLRGCLPDEMPHHGQPVPPGHDCPWRP